MQYAYDWYDFEVRLGEMRFPIRSAEKFETKEKARGRASLPFGASLWPAALVLGDWMVASPAAIAGRSVLELGCGLGLCALVAARLQAASVVATDNHPDMTELFAENCRRNAVSIAYAQYSWGDPPPGRHDIVLASDVLYEPAACNLLATAFEHTLADDGLGIVSDPGRPHAGRFVSKLQNRGYTVTEERRHVPEHFKDELKRVLDLHPTSKREHRLYFIRKTPVEAPLPASSERDPAQPSPQGLPGAE